MRRKTERHSEAGLTMIELLVASFITLVVFLGVWFTYSTNQKVWQRGRDKILLQQALTLAAEAMARDIRSGSSISMSGTDDLRIYDRFGVESGRFFIDEGRLSRAANTPVVSEECTSIAFDINEDSTEVKFTLTLKDAWQNNATIQSSAHLRNLGGFEIAVTPGS